jgi:hypothetical protein
MAKRRTFTIASADLLAGDSLYLVRARQTLPYLVRQALAGAPIYYSSLAEEVGIPNPRNLNYVLGAIGRALAHLGKQHKIEIPAIQALVVNKRDAVPGEGIGSFFTPLDFGEYSKVQKQRLVEAHLATVYTYPYWDWVLEQFDLEPLPVTAAKLLLEAKQYRGGGESEQHKQLKRYVAAHPTLLGLPAAAAHGQLEYLLPSADCIDVLFQYRKQAIGVEVKSELSDENDILRGLFQCVKYRALLEAEQVVQGTAPNSRVALVLQGKLPATLLAVKNMLGIEVLEHIHPSK